MHRDFRGLVKLLNKKFKLLKNVENFLQIINNPKLFYSLL